MLFRRTSTGWLATAPAKVNLFLRVIARRPDGFHELETVMAKISLVDQLRFECRDDDAVALAVQQSFPRSLGAMDLGNPDDNLVVKAARLLRQVTAVRQGITIILRKNVPAAAGLGGGSSDAATTLLALNAIWETGQSRRQLSQLAAQLGSDVPFFVAKDACALCTGRGEKIEPLPMRTPLHLVLAKPKTGLSTAAVFRNCTPEPDGPSVEKWREIAGHGTIQEAAQSLHNSLQTPAEMLNVEVAEMKDRFARLGVCGHQLTGSGSAYFGVCRHERHARRCAETLLQQGVPWAVAVTTQTELHCKEAIQRA